MADFKKLMVEAASMSMDELEARQKEIQSAADFLSEMLRMRRKLGERTSEQLKRKARREEKSNVKKSNGRPRTAGEPKTSVNPAKAAPERVPVSEEL